MDLVKHHTVKVERTAHYYTLGNLSERTQFVWFVCHGYGQAADRFISKFETLDADRHFVIAPEGLSRFYWKGVGGIPVASWMTRKDREYEIADQIKYLAQVLTSFEVQTMDLQFVFFGFSQGCATIMRYLDKSRHRFSKVILWGGTVPPDIDFRTWERYLKNEQIHLIYGDVDEYVTPERRAKLKSFLETKGPPYCIHEYEGGHRIIPEVFDSVISSILKT